MCMASPLHRYPASSCTILLSPSVRNHSAFFQFTLLPSCYKAYVLAVPVPGMLPSPLCDFHLVLLGLVHSCPPFKSRVTHFSHRKTFPRTLVELYSLFYPLTMLVIILSFRICILAVLLHLCLRLFSGNLLLLLDSGLYGGKGPCLFCLFSLFVPLPPSRVPGIQ